ncbi:MAG: arylsulfatase, partial [Planctomycetota bacterium]|nr:arylsulfatase [Planctomycetota bacterium]
SELASTIDLFPTLLGFAGGKTTSLRTIDGLDIGRLMTGEEKDKSPRDLFYFYEGQQLQAVRRGPWKLFLPLESFERHPYFSKNEKARTLLFNVREDPSSRNDRTQEFPEVVAKLMADAEVARQELGDLGHFGSQQRAAGYAGQVSALRVSQEGNSEER